MTCIASNCEYFFQNEKCFLWNVLMDQLKCLDFFRTRNHRFLSAFFLYWIKYLCTESRSIYAFQSYIILTESSVERHKQTDREDLRRYVVMYVKPRKWGHSKPYANNDWVPGLCLNFWLLQSTYLYWISSLFYNSCFFGERTLYFLWIWSF